MNPNLKTSAAFRQSLISGAIFAAVAAIVTASGQVMAAAANPDTTDKTMSLAVGQARTALSAFADTIAHCKTEEIAKGDAYAPIDHTLLTQDVIDSLGEGGFAKRGTMRLVITFLHKEGEPTFQRVEEIANVALGKLTLALDEIEVVGNGDQAGMLGASLKFSHAVAGMMADLTATATLIAQADLIANDWSFVPLASAHGVMTTNLVGGMPKTDAGIDDIRSKTTDPGNVGTAQADQLATAT